MSALAALKAKMEAEKKQNGMIGTTKSHSEQDNSETQISVSTPAPILTPVPEPKLSGPLTEFQQLSQEVSELASAILAQHPTMPVLLRKIHTTLSQYPEQVTLLSEDQIKTIVEGLQVQTGTFFASIVTTPKQDKSLKSRIAKLGADAF